LQPDIRKLLTEAESLTAANTALNLVIAFNYGARDELVRAARKIAEKVAAGKIDPAAVDADMMAAHLDTADMPDPDLVIRTSGELRLSNFLLWQAAYSELVFLPCYWPDFNRDHFAQAVMAFGARDRRYGGRKESAQ
jgi:undecaprenyl diphosphate synthase